MGLASQSQEQAGAFPGTVRILKRRQSIHGAHPLGWRLVARQGCVNDAGIVDRTGGDTLRLVEMANAFGTFCWFNDEAPRLLRDCNVRA